MPAPRKAASKRTPRWRIVAFVSFLLLCVWIGYEYGTLPHVGNLEKENPKTTALIEHRFEQARAEGRKGGRQQSWIPLSRVATPAIDAILISEDARFYDHGGVDLHETRVALEKAWKEKELGRGASTITQQLAKNLWLSNERSLLRKLKEVVLARRLEEGLSKRRILALYVNVAEWGDGVYGIEAASRRWFGVTASELSVAEGAILAGMLPAPLKWNPERRSPALAKRARRIVERLERFGRITEAEAHAARAELDGLFGAAD